MPEPGERVRVVVDADPTVVELLGDRFGPEANWTFHATVALLALLSLLPWWSAGRAVALASSWSTTTMVGVIAERRRWLRRSTDLDVFEPGARVGDRPVCTVPILTLPPVPVGVPFAVTVAGRPDRRRHLVAATAGPEAVTLWPRRRALAIAHGVFVGGRPSEPATWPAIDPPTRLGGLVSTRSLRAPLVCVLAGVVIAVWVGVATMQHAIAAADFDRRAERRIGEVVRYLEEDTVVEFRLVTGEPRRVRTTAEVDANDYPKGTRYELLVDRDETNRVARLVSEPYDRGEPIGWGLLVLIGSSIWLLTRQLRRRAIVVAARRGPWRRIRVEVDADHRSWAVSLLGTGDDAIGWLSVEGDTRSSWHLDDATDAEMYVAGEPGLQSPLALWRPDGSPMAVDGPMRMPSSRVPALVVPFDGGDLEEKPVSASEGTLVPLRPNPFGRRSRRPFARVSARFVEVYAPQWFGQVLWRIPTHGMAFTDLTSPFDDPHDDEAIEGVLMEPALAPHLVTSTQGSTPNVGLLFDEPQRIPPLRWWMIGSQSGIRWFESRSEGGTVLDGVQLQFDDARVAVAALRRAGIEQVGDTNAWFMRRRETATDPEDVDRIVRRTTRRLVLRALVVVCGLAGIITLVLSGDDPSPWRIVVGIVLVAVPWSISSVVELLDARGRRARRRRSRG